jgi:hypothetical protein
MPWGLWVRSHGFVMCYTWQNQTLGLAVPRCPHKILLIVAGIPSSARAHATLALLHACIRAAHAWLTKCCQHASTCFLFGMQTRKVAKAEVMAKSISRFPLLQALGILDFKPISAWYIKDEYQACNAALGLMHWYLGFLLPTYILVNASAGKQRFMRERAVKLVKHTAKRRRQQPPGP